MRTQARKRSAILYGTLAGLFSLVIAWWIVFFARQGSFMVERLEQQGMALSEEQAEALRAVASHSSRMFLFEGAFLGLIGLGGMWLIWRSMRRELVLHRQQRDFLSAVTHELRSPIAAARLQVESLKLGRVPEAKVDRYLTRTLDDLDRLSQTVNQLLEAARSNSGRVELSMETIDLGSFIARSSKKHAEALGVEAQFALKLAEDVLVPADPEALETIFSNLVSNGLKYGGEPARLCISVSRSAQYGVLEVQDSGSGIESEEAKEIFDPFVRGQGDLVKRRPGIGLGLYLVAQLSASMGAEVSARNIPEGQGFVVSIKLPLVKQREGDK